MMVNGNELEGEIARLRDLDFPALRARWRTVFRRIKLTTESFGRGLG
jgi:hypothetical protein